MKNRLMENRKVAKPTYSIAIKRFVMFSCIILLLGSGCNSSKRSAGKQYSKQTSKKSSNKASPRGRKKQTKPLVVADEVYKNHAGASNYFTITINPDQPGKSMANYFISVQKLAGHGNLLLGVKEETKSGLQYTVILKERERMSLGSLLPAGKADQFYQEKSIKFRCRYDPQIGSQQGDQHRLAITISEQDDHGQVIRQKQAEVGLAVKKNINAG